MPLIKRTEPAERPSEKKKILFISDNPLAPSGVGIQARLLIEGLISTGQFRFFCLGGAIRHQDYNITQVNPDFIIKPVDNFGTKEMLRNILYSEQPDAIVIFTDPRQFIWLWEMQDEIRQVCPLTYWHVWDNDPYPDFNKVLFDSTDTVNCLSWKTYEMMKPHFADKVKYIPHAFPPQMYFPGPVEEVKTLRRQNFQDKSDWFISLWANRNASRKMPSDVMESWKIFLDLLEEKHGHRKAILVMHTDPMDLEGPNLLMVQQHLGLQDNVLFSTQKVEFGHMNVLHNTVDCCINISKNEGFGLATLISLQVGKPIVVLKTGGLTRQVIDHRNGNELGVGLEPIARKLIGGQQVPYIYEDYADKDETAEALMKIYELTDAEKQTIKEQATSYVSFEFNFEKMINDWAVSLNESIAKWEKNKEAGKWSLSLLNTVHAPVMEVLKAPSPAPVPVKTALLPSHQFIRLAKKENK